jgi:hypothetical protein
LPTGGGGSIATQVDVFRTSVGAHGSFAWTTKYIETHRLNGLKLARFSTGAPPGAEARGYVTRVMPQGLTVVAYFVLWRYANIVGTAVASGPQASVAPKTAVTVARKMQARIKAVLG